MHSFGGQIGRVLGGSVARAPADRDGGDQLLPAKPQQDGVHCAVGQVAGHCGLYLGGRQRVGGGPQCREYVVLELARGTSHVVVRVRRPAFVDLGNGPSGSARSNSGRPHISQ
jgi:hypothetical protein